MHAQVCRGDQPVNIWKVLPGRHFGQSLQSQESNYTYTILARSQVICTSQKYFSLRKLDSSLFTQVNKHCTTLGCVFIERFQLNTLEHDSTQHKLRPLPLYCGTVTVPWVRSTSYPFKLAFRDVLLRFFQPPALTCPEGSERSRIMYSLLPLRVVRSMPQPCVDRFEYS